MLIRDTRRWQFENNLVRLSAAGPIDSISAGKNLASDATVSHTTTDHSW